MKKTLALALLAAAAVSGYHFQTANAQNAASVNVGNPDSANLLIMEEGVAVVTPDSQADVNTVTPDWTQEGNVEVAPLPENQSQSENQPQSQENMTVDESVSESVTPDSSMVDVNETISQ